MHLEWYDPKLTSHSGTIFPADGSLTSDLIGSPRGLKLYPGDLEVLRYMQDKYRHVRPSNLPKLETAGHDQDKIQHVGHSRRVCLALPSPAEPDKPALL